MNPKMIPTSLSLSLIKQILNENHNIYSPSLDNITKDLDIEDKIFIEQTTLEIKTHGFSVSSPVRLPHPDHSPLSTDKLQVLLKNIGKDWHFNTLFIADLSENNPLYTCGEYVFKYLNFTQHFHISGKILENFLKITESRYLNNPYHNACHAADVMNSFMYLIHPFMRLVPSTEMISCIVSCLGHDLKHPGKNNRFLIQTKDKLAYVYNDNSVLENMHACEVFNILNEDKANIVSFVEDFDFFRKVVIELILSTDMAKHFEFLAGMNLFRMNIDELMGTSSGRLVVFKIMIKSADIGHTSKTLNVHKKWCSLIIEEFFTQGDEEKRRNLSVSMYCDRNNTDISKSQAGFLKNIALPLFITLHKIMGSTDHHQECISQLKSNISYWENKRDKNKFTAFRKRIDSGRTYTFTENNDDKYSFDTKVKAFIRNFD